MNNFSQNMTPLETRLSAHCQTPYRNDLIDYHQIFSDEIFVLSVYIGHCSFLFLGNMVEASTKEKYYSRKWLNDDVIIEKNAFSRCTSDEDLALWDFVHRLFQFSSVKRPNQLQILPSVPVWLLGTRLDELNLVLRKWFVPDFSLITL